MTTQFISLLIALNPLDFTKHELFILLIVYASMLNGSGPEDPGRGSKQKRPRRKK